MTLRQQAGQIMAAALAAAQPDTAVKAALAGEDFSGPGKLVLIAVGKAAWEMAAAARQVLGQRVTRGVVITKTGHSRGPIGNMTVLEAGHPVPNEASFAAARAAVEAVSGLSREDRVLFLLSGGGSALFELPLIDPEDLERMTRELLASGADIGEINTLRKRFSGVKGGRFGLLCQPAQVLAVVLSDVLGDRLDMIASGPVTPDSSTCDEAKAIAEKYRLTLSPQMRSLLEQETPKQVPGVKTVLAGNVRLLCRAAEEQCRALGYEPVFLTDGLCCTAADAGVFLGNIARSHSGGGKKLAFLAGGETVVRLTGSGLGGRNQEIALAAAEQIAGLEGVCVFSFGSDGTDGPTDAAGGFVDGAARQKLEEQGISIPKVLAENDAYHALARCEGLLITGPTGTNVNDLSVALVAR